MRAIREACGCKHDQERWLELCAAHRAEHAAVHEQAQSEFAAKRAAQPQPTEPAA